MNHNFDLSHACAYGVDEAIFISNLTFWIIKNKANKVNLFDGRTWTYNRYSAFESLFPYWSKDQIRRIVQSLRNQKVIITRQQEGAKRNDGLYYAFFVEEEFIPTFQNEDEKTQKGVGISPDSVGISPDSVGISPHHSLYKYNNTDNKKYISCPSDDGRDKNLFFWEKFYEVYPKKTKKKRSREIFIEYNLYNEIDRILNDIEKRKIHDLDWQDMQFIPHPSKYLEDRRWDDEDLCHKEVRKETTTGQNEGHGGNEMAVNIKSIQIKHCEFVHQEKNIGEPGYTCHQESQREVLVENSSGSQYFLHVCPHHENLMDRKEKFKYYSEELRIVKEGSSKCQKAI